MLQRDYDLKDPESKTKFHQEIAKRLCTFQEEVERDNYIEAVAEKYNIGFENLRRLVIGYAAKTGLVSEATRPKSGIQSKQTPQDATKRTQLLFLTWLVEEPKLFEKIQRYITPEDFTTELYKKVATKLFDDLEMNRFNPAAIISMFTDEEEQKEVAGLFNTKLEQLETKQEREKAFHDIVVNVKKNSYEQASANLGADVNALTKVIEGKKALQELEKTHIYLD